MAVRYIACLGLLLVASGCAYNRQFFRPTERVRGQTMQGYEAAFYELVGPNGRFGEAKIWSAGAYRKGDDTVIEVTLEVHNTSGRPSTVSAQDLSLDPVRGSGGELRKVPPAETGTFTIAPEARASVRTHFLLPRGWLPGHVRGFALQWKVRNVDQNYAQATPFREEVYYYAPPAGYIYYSPVYPCSPWDVSCVGFYGGWPYGPGFGGSVVVPGPPRPPPVERRRVEVP